MIVCLLAAAVKVEKSSSTKQFHLLQAKVRVCFSAWFCLLWKSFRIILTSSLCFHFIKDLTSKNWQLEKARSSDKFNNCIPFICVSMLLYLGTCHIHTNTNDRKKTQLTSKIYDLKSLKQNDMAACILFYFIFGQYKL